MDPEKVHEAVKSLFSEGDQTILEYICGILEDEHFEFGDEGDSAYESIGPFLVRMDHLHATWAVCMLGSVFRAGVMSCHAKCHAVGWGLLQKRGGSKGGMQEACCSSIW